MRRPLIALLALALLLTAVACGERTTKRTPTAVTAIATPEPRPKPTERPSPKPKRAGRGSWVHVTVVDGDRGKRVHGAFVRIGRHGRVTDRKGVARVHLKRRAALVVHVQRRGYTPAQQRFQFRKHPLRTIRVYQPALQWTMYGVDTKRTQTQPNIRLRPPFRIVWSRGMAGLLEFPAVVSDGVAYVANSWGSIRAVSMRNGKLVWRHDIRYGKMASSPAIWRDQLIVHGMDGTVWAFDRRNGRLRWHKWIGSPIESSPVVRTGVDYFGAWNGTVYALDLRSHRIRWSYSAGAKITSSAAVVGGTVYIGNYAGRLLAFVARTGRFRFAAAVNGRIYGTPAVAAGRIFVPSSDGNSLTAFSRTGAQKWTIHTGAYVYSSPAVWAGRVYFGSYNGVLYCVSPRSGRVLWSRSTGGSISAAPVVVDGVVYFGNFSHRIYGLDARSGRQRFRFPDGDYVPVSGNGGRLLLHGYSRLYAVEPRRR
jgi:eukaryotic-like serine/threonine-protein kinase